MRLDKYQTTEKVTVSKYHSLYLSSEQDTEDHFLIQVIHPSKHSSTDILRFRHEFEKRQALQDPFLVPLVDLVSENGVFGLVTPPLEDIPLNNFLIKHTGGLDLNLTLNIALSLTRTLERLHKADVVLGVLRPQDIYLNSETQTTKLASWGLSTLLTHENDDIYCPEMIRNNLAYFAPEQTGRINRHVDFRSDLYSLGTVLYELLTGNPPFLSEDPLEIIHAHIAREPVPANRVKQTIPEAVSSIVAKLLSKSAENRYQSHFGLDNDLSTCLNELADRGTIAPFDIGARDVPSRFRIPEVVLGRRKEIETLMGAFHESIKGQNRLLLVSGRPGIGKSALIHEVRKPIVAQNGYFLCGKYHQFGGDLPFSAIAKAFDSFFNQVATESDARLSMWRGLLLGALGPNGKIILDLSPSLKMIIGEQPEVPILDAEQAQNRLHIVFGKLLEAIASKENPLVLFLDDLQWSDGASLKLIKSMITNNSIKHFLLIGAYRHEEIDRAHILHSHLKEVENTGAQITRIMVNPLEEDSVTEFIARSLNSSSEKSVELSMLVNRKTIGNPFFIKQFLQTIHADGLLSFDKAQSAWIWDLEQIQKMDVTDNVVELLARKIVGLDKTNQEILKICAIIGSSFDLETVARAIELSTRQTYQSMASLIKESYIEISGNQYRFQHDRIREAAYSLLSINKRTDLHFIVGRDLLERSTGNTLAENLFFIVNHLNAAKTKVSTAAGKFELAELNYKAGLRAKSSAAYDTALHYFETGIALAPSVESQQNTQLMAELYTEGAEAAFLCTEPETMEKFCDNAMELTPDLLKRIRIYETRIQAYTGWGRQLESIRLAKEALLLLGIKYPGTVSKISIVGLLVRAKFTLAGKDIAKLSDLPPMEDPIQLAAMRIMLRLSTAAYFISTEMFIYNGLRSLLYSLKHGNAPESIPAYGLYSIILCGKLNKYDEGYRFGSMALELSKKFDNQRQRARALFQFNCFVRHWKEPCKTVLEPLAESFQIALEVGDTEIASYPAFNYCLNQMVCGVNISAAIRNTDFYNATLKQLGQDKSLKITLMLRQVYQNLSSPVENPEYLVGDYADSNHNESFYRETKNMTGLFTVYSYNTYLAYIFGDTRLAYQNVKKLKSVEHAGHGVLFLVVVYQLYCLVSLRAYDELDSREKKRAMSFVRKSLRQLKKWRDHSPRNNTHRVHLIEAEIARIAGRTRSAVDNYEQAIQTARQNGFENDEALAFELFGRFWQQRESREFAQYCLGRARQVYSHHGAHGKAAHLVKMYPDFDSGDVDQASLSTTHHAVTNTSEQVKGAGEALDIQSVIKASQAISSEIVLSKLLSRLLHVVMENAGAASGALVLESSGKLMVEAIVSLEQENTVRVSSIPVSEFKDGSQAVIRYVYRKREPVVLGDATDENQFGQDPYVKEHQPYSILCMPIHHRDSFIGMFYLENRIARDVFTDQRVELIGVLASQAAISIDNAKLYGRLKNSTILLEEALAEAKKSSQVKTEFLARTSHELKTPLNLIINLPEALLEKYHRIAVVQCIKCEEMFEIEDDEQPNDDTMCPSCETIGSLRSGTHGCYQGDLDEVFCYLEAVNDSGRKLLGIVDDLLDISELESGKSRVYVETISIKEIVHHATNTHLKTAGQKRITFEIQNMNDQWELTGDRRKLTQVFSNLFSNAVKFSPKDSSVIFSAVVSEKEFLLSVRDCGEGITKEKQELIFDSFSQADSGTTRRHGGTGLGLSISKHFVELHGGQLWVESEPGCGSTFYVKLPKSHLALVTSSYPKHSHIPQTPVSPRNDNDDVVF